MRALLRPGSAVAAPPRSGHRRQRLLVRAPPESTSRRAPATCAHRQRDPSTCLSNATVEGTSTAKVRVYARNYNVLAS